MHFLVSLRAVNGTVAKYPLNQFYFIDKKCVLKCKSETIDGIMQTEISKVMFMHIFKINKDISKIEEEPQAYRM